MSATVILCPRLVTCDPARATLEDPLGVLEDGATVIDGDTIVAVGHRSAILARFADARLVQAPGVVTPGLVDAHTHAPWMGSRHAEYALRMSGAGYEAIAAAGGGILATTRAVRAASLDAIADALATRLARMAALGVTTVETKSGYGLDEPSETKQLEAIRRASGRADLPRVVATYLALHTLPPDLANLPDGRASARAAYARVVEQEWLPRIAAAGLARFVDAYVDRNAFSTEDAAPVLRRARALGLGVRVHAGQFADVGAAELAAEVGASSADHLEHVGLAGAEALAARGVRAVLLPIASFTLKQEPPPIAVLRAAGVRFVVASDANPGTAPTESLPLALALAVRSYGLTVAEAILGATREAAASLGLADVTGALREGFAADLVLWEPPHEVALVQPWGTRVASATLRGGKVIAGTW